MFIGRDSSGWPLRQERNKDGSQRHGAPRERAIIDRSDYKHVARAPSKLDISDWVKVPIEKV